jgi:hypothetical protein
MERMGLIAPGSVWRARDSVSDERLWEERPVTILDEKMAARKVEILTSGWPFRDGVPVVPAVGPRDTLGQIVEQVTRSRWTWERAHEEALAYYRGREEWGSVEKEYRVIVSQTPLDIQPQLGLAHFYMRFSRPRSTSSRRSSPTDRSATSHSMRAARSRRSLITAYSGGSRRKGTSNSKTVTCSGWRTHRPGHWTVRGRRCSGSWP